MSMECLTYGGRSEHARTVIVYGNCQAPFLCEQLSRLDDLNADYRFVAALNHGFPDPEVPPPVPDIHFRDVALYLSQHEDQPGRPSRLALESRLPHGCPVIRFPSFVMNSLWPFECPEPRLQSVPEYPIGRFPAGDMIGLEIGRAGLTGPISVAAYMDLSLRKMPDMAVRLERDIKRMRHYDAHCDIALTDWVLDHVRSHHLFWTAGHVSALGVAELTRRVASVARPILGGSAERADACLAASMDYGGMGGLQLPIHPAVSDALGLSYGGPDQIYRWYSQEWNFFEYIERYIAYDTNW